MNMKQATGTEGADKIKLINTFSQNISTAFDSLYKIFDSISRSVYDAYILDGAIYGESRDGMARWLNDLNEIRQHENAIEQIKDHHEMLRTLKTSISKEKKQ